MNTVTREPATRVAAATAHNARPKPQGRKAASAVHESLHTSVSLPGLGSLRLPNPEHLAYYGGLVILGAIEIIEWPAAMALAVGHMLINNQHSKAFKAFGEALEDA